MAKSGSGILMAAATFTALFIAADVDAARAEVLEGPAHEAFITPASNGLVVKTVKAEPPKPIKEIIPEQTDPQAEWVPGYWSWSSERGDFIWVSGMWRRPPPERHWIPGYWQEFEEGYGYIRGFWSKESPDSIQYISQVPPAPIEEKLTQPPGESYFWTRGHWGYNSREERYSWYSGRWEKQDPSWMLVPAHYVWRPEGFVFVSAYWDWALKERGDVYAALWIPTSIRIGFEHQPTKVLEPALIIRDLYAYNPDYTYFFFWHYTFHPDFWISFNVAPPWWDWKEWWSITPADQWSLWWWWSHPGYASPSWMGKSVASKISPPDKRAQDLVASAATPVNVLPNGVVTDEQIIETLSTHSPVLPANSKVLEKELAPLNDRLTAIQSLRPTGKIAPQIADLAKPKFRDAIAVNSRSALAEVPAKPTNAKQSPSYRERPAADEDQVKPRILQPVFPSRRPNLDRQLRDPAPRNLFTPREPERPQFQRQEYNPPVREYRDNPYAEERRVYRPQRPKYEAPRGPNGYTPSTTTFDSGSGSSIPSDVYSPPSSSTYAPTESIRTPTRRGRVYKTTIESDRQRFFSPEAAPERGRDMERSNRRVESQY